MAASCNVPMTIRIIGILQLVVAILITIVGIIISVRFHRIHHENGTPYEMAQNYVENPWTTKYGAGIWMGIIIFFGGLFGSFADLKPHKSKYRIYSFVLNIAVLAFAIILIVYSLIAMSWFEQCKYVYIQSDGNSAVANCSSDDKSSGKMWYTLLLTCVVVIVVLTIPLLVLLLFENIEVFRDCCNPRKMIYKWKGKTMLVDSIKTKNTHEFNQIVETPPV